MTMYLTRAIIPKYDVLRLRLCDRYAWHQKIWKTFPGIPEGTVNLFQWRIDRKETGTILWILSTKQPDFQCWKCRETTDFQAGIHLETKKISESFLGRRRYVFSLCANPTVMKTAFREDGTVKKNGRRVAICHEDDLKDWLCRKGKDAGFRLEKVRVTLPVKEYFSKGGGKKQSGVHSCVDFTGILNVVDLEKFSVTYKTGIGSAKGFGFGLLLLKPVE